MCKSRSWDAARVGAGGRPRIHRPASCDHPKCRERATCARGRGRCERPGGRLAHSSAPGCGASLLATRGSLAGRIREEKKSISCVTTRRRKLRFLSGLGRGLGLLPARAFRLSVLSSDFGILPPRRLAPRRLPAADQPAAFRLLTIALVPGPGLVRTAAPFAQADPRPRSAGPSRTAMLPFNLGGAHGRLVSHGKSPGRMCQHSPRAHRDTIQTAPSQSTAVRRTKTKNETVLEMRAGRRRED